MVGVWSNSETYKHCFFIPLICSYLIYEKRHAFSSEPLKFSYWPLFPLLLIQCFFTVASILEINVFMHLSAYFSLVLIVFSLFGYDKIRVIFFPLLYLVFAVPVGEELVPILQTITADLSVGMLNLTPVPVFREGLYIHVPNGTFHVAEACAGIRFLIGTFSIGVLLAYLNYQKMWKRLVFTLLCLIVPVLANGIRAFGIMMIGYYSDMEYATGADHLVYGWVFFAFVTLMIFWMSTFGNDKEVVKSNGQNPSVFNATFKNGRYGLQTVGICVVLLLPAVFTKVFIEANSHIVVASPFSLISEKYPNVAQENHEWTAKSSDSTWEGIIDGISVSIIYVDESVGKRELVSSRHRIFDADKWSQTDIKQISIDGIELLNVHLVNAVGKQAELLAWYQLKDFQSYSGFEVKLQQLALKLSGQPSNGYFIVAAVDEMNEKQVADMLTKFSKLSR